jgi:hypothetical protein
LLEIKLAKKGSGILNMDMVVDMGNMVDMKVMGRLDMKIMGRLDMKVIGRLGMKVMGRLDMEVKNIPMMKNPCKEMEKDLAKLVLTAPLLGLYVVNTDTARDRDTR